MKSKSSKKTAKTGPQDATKKVFDVMRPGKTPVSPTSRPVIVGHKPQVKDPMMSDRDERPLMDSNKKVTVQPAADASVPLPPTDKDTGPATLPPTDADSGGLPSANPSLAQVDSRTAPVAGGTDGGAPGAPQPSGEHDGEASMSDRTRTEASELVGGSTGEASASDGGRTEPEEATTAPEVPENEKLTEQTTAESVATIATSSVVDDVPSPPETTTSPQPPHPMTTGNTTSGLVFDDPDDILNSDASTSPVAGGTDGGAPGAPQPPGEHDGEASMSDRTRTDDSAQRGGGEPAVSGQAIVSHHKQSSGMTTVLISLLVLLLVAGIIIDILLDMSILNISNIPHTNFFPSN